MSNSQFSSDAVERLLPRKLPSQSRSSYTVDVILEAAAHILEECGFDGYTTNDIAERAGVSIGSLYQYFPNKDAVTVALIEDEAVSLAADVKEALSAPGDVEPLRKMIDIAVLHQFRRPRFAKLLDFEQDRLAPVMPQLNDAADIRLAIAEFLQKRWRLQQLKPDNAAADIIRMVSVLTDAAGRRDETDGLSLANRIHAAVLAYLRAVE